MENKNEFTAYINVPAYKESIPRDQWNGSTTLVWIP